MVRSIELRFQPVNESLIEPQTYLYYIQTQLEPSGDGVWVPYNEETEKTLLEDFKRLWATNFLDNLWIEVIDAPYPNGVVGKHVIFHMEERPRVKIVDYTGSDQGRAHQDRREDEGARRRAAPRLVPRSGRRPPRRGHRAQS